MGIQGLGLESSCDETAASVVKDGSRVLSNVISSQVDLHREYYGVVPELASRAHLEIINSLVDEALSRSGSEFRDLSYVAATSRPGLVGSLLIALQTAKALAYSLDIPLVAVNHLEAHLYAPFLEGNDLEFPFLGLLISGGNTALYRVQGIGETELLGKSHDDAVGEAFDKVSKLFELGYPGGPLIEAAASRASKKEHMLPRIMADRAGFDFSYSGIKTAVINHMRKNPDTPVEEVAWSFQERALEILVRRLFHASRETGIKRLVVAGGVAANGRLRQMLEEKRENEEVLIPSPALCTDNAAMIAGIGYQYYRKGHTDDLSVDVAARLT